MWVLTTFPAGVFLRRWHRTVVRALGALAVLGPLAHLLGSPSLDVGGEGSTAVRNVLALDGLATLGSLGAGVIASEQAWLLLLFLMGLGAFSRHFYNLRHAGRTHWWMPVAAAVAVVAVDHLELVVEPR